MAVKLERRAGLFGRSLFLQGSFNYGSLVGPGFAWLLLPVLCDRYGSGQELDAAVERHAEPFNSHPYLVGLAVGGVVRLETDGTEASTVGRFKEALRGPLGGVGDRLIWSGLRPTTLLIALVLWALGATPWLIVASFLILYNGIHLYLRWWGLRAGFESGLEVAARLRRAALGRWTDRIVRIGSVLLGLLFGLLTSGSFTLGWTHGLPWLAAAVLAFWLGLRFGRRAGRPARLGLAGAIMILAIFGLQ